MKYISHQLNYLNVNNIDSHIPLVISSKQVETIFATMAASDRYNKESHNETIASQPAMIAIQKKVATK